MKPRSVRSEANEATITADEARVTYGGREYVIVAVQDEFHAGQWTIWAMKPNGRKMIQGTLFGFAGPDQPRVWISKSITLPTRHGDKNASDESWTDKKREAAGRILEIREYGRLQS